MNSPEEKAKELVGKFKEYTEDKYAEHWHDAKACSLICVDEIIGSHTDNLNGDNIKEKEYWQKVKEEIQKL